VLSVLAVQNFIETTINYASRRLPGNFRDKSNFKSKFVENGAKRAYSFATISTQILSFGPFLTKLTAPSTVANMV
jgi:hypothetical protein